MNHPKSTTTADDAPDSSRTQVSSSATHRALRYPTMPVTPKTATEIIAGLGVYSSLDNHIAQQSADCSAYPGPTLDTLADDAFVRQRQLLKTKTIPFSASTLWRMVRRGTFPEPVKISDKITAWRMKDIRSWQRNPANYSSFLSKVSK